MKPVRRKTKAAKCVVDHVPCVCDVNRLQCVYVCTRSFAAAVLCGCVRVSSVRRECVWALSLFVLSRLEHVDGCLFGRRCFAVLTASPAAHIHTPVTTTHSRAVSLSRRPVLEPAGCGVPSRVPELPVSRPHDIVVKLDRAESSISHA